jgi:hypothetical protein
MLVLLTMNSSPRTIGYNAGEDTFQKVLDFAKIKYLFVNQMTIA